MSFFFFFTFFNLQKLSHFAANFCLRFHGIEKKKSKFTKPSLAGVQYEKERRYDLQILSLSFTG